MFNISRQTSDETTHITFDKDSLIHDQIDHPSSIMNKLTFNPSDPDSEFLSNVTKPVVPNVDHVINSQPNSEDHSYRI